MKTIIAMGIRNQTRLQNCQRRKPHCPGCVVVMANRPPIHTARSASVSTLRSIPAAQRQPLMAVHSQEAVNQTMQAACARPRHPVSRSMRVSWGFRHSTPPLSTWLPTQMAAHGTTTQVTNMKPTAASAHASHWPRKTLCSGLFSQILAWAPSTENLARSELGVALRSMCKYQAAMAIRICLALARCSVAPRASATLRTYSGSSAATGFSSFSSSRASLRAAGDGIGQSPRLSSTLFTDRPMLT
mmetsp:Transcript_74181/g.217326  ORF Transcript_74181/g.217326 Transcript_74181/m.217326 type:complete len:244 (+) Transcript_74181:124-855(+)